MSMEASNLTKKRNNEFLNELRNYGLNASMERALVVEIAPNDHVDQTHHFRALSKRLIAKSLFLPSL
jgi:hypothetical protein